MRRRKCRREPVGLHEHGGSRILPPNPALRGSAAYYLIMPFLISKERTDQLTEEKLMDENTKNIVASNLTAAYCANRPHLRPTGGTTAMFEKGGTMGSDLMS